MAKKKRGKRIVNKDENAEDWCFICKDGGELMICDYGKCLKAYHPACVGKDDSALKSDERWICGWHRCLVCQGNSEYHCYCCDRAACYHCIGRIDFVHLKGKYGLCNNCLKLALLVEEHKNVDSDGESVDLRDQETYEGLFREYYEIVKKKEGFHKNKLLAGKAQLDKEKIGRISSDTHVRSEKEDERSEEEDKQISSDNGDFSDGEPQKKRLKKKRCIQQKTRMKRRVNSTKKEFVGWGSKALIDFLQLIGQDTNEKLSQYDVTSIVTKYIKEHNLSHPVKKRRILCDAQLEAVFGKKVINRQSVFSLLESHFLENEERLQKDELDHDLEDDDDTEMLVAPKTEKKVEQNKISSMWYSTAAQSQFAAMIPENIKLVYLKRSLVLEMIKQPESIETKIIGSFVRVKLDPCDYQQRNSHQLVQIAGIEHGSSDMCNSESLIVFPNVGRGVCLRMLSDGDFTKEECDNLREKVKAGLLKKLTIMELEQKAEILHEDITKHRIARELKLLENLIDRENEKGRRYEMFQHLEQRKNLKEPSYLSFLLQNIPRVIPEEVETEPVAKDERDVNQIQQSSDKTTLSPTKKNIPGLIPKEVELEPVAKDVRNVNQIQQSSDETTPTQKNIAGVIPEEVELEPLAKDKTDVNKMRQSSDDTTPTKQNIPGVIPEEVELEPVAKDERNVNQMQQSSDETNPAKQNIPGVIPEEVEPEPLAKDKTDDNKMHCADETTPTDENNNVVILPPPGAETEMGGGEMEVSDQSSSFKRKSFSSWRMRPNTYQQESLSQYDVTSIATKYTKEYNLTHPVKKRRILSDAQSQDVFGKKVVDRVSKFSLLESHFVENVEPLQKGELNHDREDNDTEMLVAPKTEKKVAQNMISSILYSGAAQSRFAAVIPENIKLVYLERSLVLEMIKQPESIETKIIGSFVRVKLDPCDHHPRNSHQLVQIAGIKHGSSDKCNSESLIVVPNLARDVCLTMLSDGDFSKEECDDLREKVKAGLLKKLTIVEIEQTAEILHEDITKHRIARELKLLQNLIDQANEKGWRYEMFQHLEKRKLLQQPSYLSFLLQNIPRVIPEEVESEPVAKDKRDVNQVQQSSDETTPTKQNIPGAIPKEVELEPVAKHEENVNQMQQSSDETTPTKQNLPVVVPEEVELEPLAKDKTDDNKMHRADETTPTDENNDAVILPPPGAETEMGAGEMEVSDLSCGSKRKSSSSSSSQRIRLNNNQWERVRAFAEKMEWKWTKKNEQVVPFCDEIGITPNFLRNWIDNNKRRNKGIKKKQNIAGVIPEEVELEPLAKDKTDVNKMQQCSDGTTPTKKNIPGVIPEEVELEPVAKDERNVNQMQQSSDETTPTKQNIPGVIPEEVEPEPLAKDKTDDNKMHCADETTPTDENNNVVILPPPGAETEMGGGEMEVSDQSGGFKRKSFSSWRMRPNTYQQENLSQYDVTSIATKYTKEHNLTHPVKKRRILSDAQSQDVFGKKVVDRVSKFSLLESHFVENVEPLQKGELNHDREDNDTEMLVAPKTEKKVEQHKISSILYSSAAQSRFAAVIPENIKLVYLERSLVLEMIKQPESIETKIIGSFVRVKLDPCDHHPRNSHQLVQIAGIKHGSSDKCNSESLIVVPNLARDVFLTMLSDGDFSKEECDDLREKVKAGLLTKQTIVELEQKAEILHEDITKHRIAQELKLLQNLIDQANEKGWRYEMFQHLEKRKLLQQPSYLSFLLQNIPRVIPEEVETEPVAKHKRNVNQMQQSSDETTPIKQNNPGVIPEDVELEPVAKDERNDNQMQQSSDETTPTKQNLPGVVPEEVELEPLANDKTDDNKMHRADETTLTDENNNVVILPPPGVETEMGGGEMEVADQSGSSKRKSSSSSASRRMRLNNNRWVRVRAFVEKMEWKWTKKNEQVVPFCDEIGITPNFLRNWIDNNKRRNKGIKKKQNIPGVIPEEVELEPLAKEGKDDNKMHRSTDETTPTVVVKCEPEDGATCSGSKYM